MSLPLIIYSDDYLIVVDKPAGLLSVPGRGEANQDCVAVRVQAAFPDALIVHRLDMATSGLMVMARGKAAHRSLSMAFEARQVDKHYVAVVAGQVAADEGAVDLPLITDWPNRPRQRVDHDIGKPSLTRYRVLERLSDRTRVELEPVTGRSHQLRVHMMAIGHPIVGDEFYASDEVRRLSPRMLLHAQSLRLPHPQTQQPVDYVSEVKF
ncbi:RluA family pseudouridine synthase [Asticcacaulis sp. SL142]|uniref:RluA family pseudouridine synthase n=1 Tax=Asticcacaulis sp. SL142 TaxID=2995155 RepID=UPI00226CAA2A|nr:RluA family pseudouridine synthase [Asticcacaulis sp. SL142]WAC49152.1 RluA family pseudouridine synthase [Asticcacaulis sp. SL142]